MPLLARRAASATERTLVYFRMNMYIRPPMRLNSSPTHQSISGPCWTRTSFRDGSKPEKLDASRCFPLCPRKRTSRNVVGMSVSCHNRKSPRSFDHFVSELLKLQRDIEAECLCRLEIDHQLELGRLLDWQIGGLGALENLVHVGCRAPIQIRKVRSVGHKAAEIDIPL